MAEKKEKVVPPSPPLIIRDKLQGYQYKRVGFLGEVGPSLLPLLVSHALGRCRFSSGVV